MIEIDYIPFLNYQKKEEEMICLLLRNKVKRNENNDLFKQNT